MDDTPHEKKVRSNTQKANLSRGCFSKRLPRSSHRRCLDASDDQLLSLAERAVASAVVLMTLTLRIETRRRFFFFPREFLVARAARRMEKKTPSVGRVGRVGRASTRGEG